jgi:5-formyltetrahydrofolate cyclo-ligase
MVEHTDAVRRFKEQIRRQAEANRRAQPDKDALSRAVAERLAALPEFAAARTVLGYVSFGDEVRTRELLAEIRRQGKRAVIPYCAADELELFHLGDMDELTPGTLGILEPRPALRDRPGKRIDVAEVDLAIVPGVAFDRRGGRLGHGRAFFDRLLVRARPDAQLVAVAFECQLFPEVPMAAHDVFMDKIVTETAVYQGPGRRRMG